MIVTKKFYVVAEEIKQNSDLLEMFNYITSKLHFNIITGSWEEHINIPLKDFYQDLVMDREKIKKSLNYFCKDMVIVELPSIKGIVFNIFRYNLLQLVGAFRGWSDENWDKNQIAFMYEILQEQKRWHPDLKGFNSEINIINFIKDSEEKNE